MSTHRLNVISYNYTDNGVSMMSDFSDIEKTIRILNEEASKRVVIREGWTLRDEAEYRKTDAFKNSFAGKRFELAMKMDDLRSKIFAAAKDSWFFTWLAKIWLK